MSKHTPEPWSISERDATEGPAIRGPERLITILQGIVSRDRAVADAQRIVACVNACRGLSNEALEAGVAQDAVALARLVRRMLTTRGPAAVDLPPWPAVLEDAEAVVDKVDSATG